MKIGYQSILALCLLGSLFAAGCGPAEQKPLTPEDKAAMMDRSDVPKGYLEANARRRGMSGPAMPPQTPPSGQ